MEPIKRKSKRLIRWFGMIFLILCALAFIYTFTSKWFVKKCIQLDKLSVAVYIYNHQIYREFLDEEMDNYFLERINADVNTFLSDDDLSEENYLDEYEKKYEFVMDELNILSRLKSSAIVNYGKEQMTIVKNEHDGRLKYIEAEKAYYTGDFIESMKIASEIDESFSLIDSVHSLYDDSVSQILNTVATPNSVKEYEDYINKLGEYIAIVPEKKLDKRKTELEAELVVYKEVVEYIESADKFINDNDFINAVKVLHEPIKKYPEEKHLVLALEDCQSFLVLNTAEKVKELVDKREYKEALTIIEQAKEVYECEDFNILHEQVKTISKPWYRLKTSVADKASAIMLYFKKDILNVKEEGGVSYITRSGEKILLGDYSEKNVSLLSVTGSGLLSLVGLDAPLDIRDFAYDVQHIGEEENWIIWLAVDTVALLPVVGTVKYLKYAKKTGKVAETAADVSKGIDSLSDAVNAANMVDNLADTKLGKVANVGKEVKHFEHIDTINQRYKGMKHPVTGVKYNSKKIELSDGQKLEGVFPEFDCLYECKLPDNMLKESDAKQSAYCTEQLKKEIEKNPSLAKQFTTQQLEQIKNGGKISGLVWHHNEQEGVMQLVDSKIHDATKHIGGRKIWGGGTALR